jgi:hypothetical protein
VSKKDVLFESKEYGIGGHNKIELRMVDGEPRIWIRDGDTNAAICLDKADATALAKALAKASKSAPEKAHLFDFTKPIHKRKVKTTSEANGVKKKRKTRSDKGKPRKVKPVGNYEDAKAKAIQEAMK